MTQRQCWKKSKDAYISAWQSLSVDFTSPFYWPFNSASVSISANLSIHSEVIFLVYSLTPSHQDCLGSSLRLVPCHTTFNPSSINSELYSCFLSLDVNLHIHLIILISVLILLMKFCTMVSQCFLCVFLHIGGYTPGISKCQIPKKAEGQNFDRGYFKHSKKQHFMSIRS